MTEPFTPKAGMRCKTYGGKIAVDVRYYNSAPGGPYLTAVVDGVTHRYGVDGKIPGFDKHPFDLIAEAKPDEGAKVQCARRSGCITPTLCAQATFCRTEPLREAPELESDLASTIARLEAENAGFREYVKKYSAVGVQLAFSESDCGGTDIDIFYEGEGVLCRDCNAQVLGAGDESDASTWNRRAALAVQPTERETGKTHEKALTARDALVLSVPEAGFGNERAGVTIQNLAKVGWKLVPYHHYPSPGPSGFSPDEFAERETMQETADRLGVPLDEYWPLRTQKCVETLERATIERCANILEQMVKSATFEDARASLNHALVAICALPLASKGEES